MVYSATNEIKERRIVLLYFPSGDSALVVSWLPPPQIFLALSGGVVEVIIGTQISFIMTGC